MTSKPMVRFYAVIFNKIGVLLNEIYVDIRSNSEAHQPDKRLDSEASARRRLSTPYTPAFSIVLGRAGPLLLPKGESVRIASKDPKLP